MLLQEEATETQPANNPLISLSILNLFVGSLLSWKAKVPKNETEIAPQAAASTVVMNVRTISILSKF
jgi:hypothetical protein